MGLKYQTHIDFMIKSLLNLFNLNYESDILKNHLNELQFGDVLMIRCPITNPLGWGIQTFLREPYFHCALYLGNGQVFEAERRGVGKFSIDYYKIGYHITILRPKKELSSSDISYMIQTMNMMEGKDYDKSAFTYMFIILLLMKLGIVRKSILTKPDPWDNPEKYYCYQALAFIYLFRDYFQIHYTNALGVDFYNNYNFQEIYSDLK